MSVTVGVTVTVQRYCHFPLDQFQISFLKFLFRNYVSILSRIGLAITRDTFIMINKQRSHKNFFPQPAFWNFMATSWNIFNYCTDKVGWWLKTSHNESISGPFLFWLLTSCLSALFAMNFIEIKFLNLSLSQHETPSLETPDEETGNALSSKYFWVVTSINLKVLFPLRKIVASNTSFHT